MKSFLMSACFVLAMVGVCNAVEVPKGGPLDHRVRIIDYKPMEVVRITAHYGYTTTIEFAKGERIKYTGTGDTAAWEITPVDNFLFLKPKAEDADTNMTVITDRKRYTFIIRAKKANWRGTSKSVQFHVMFRYPQDEAARLAQLEKEKRLKDKLAKAKKSLDKINIDYWVKGSEEVTPNRAFDDRRFTYFKFGNNREIPAVYVLGPDESESLVNLHVEGDTLVVHKIAPRFVLRKGQHVALLVNESYDPDGIANKEGTTIKGVRRVLKGGE